MSCPLTKVVRPMDTLTEMARFPAAIGWAAYGESLSAADGIGALLIGAALVLIRLPGKSPSP